MKSTFVHLKGLSSKYTSRTGSQLLRHGQNPKAGEDDVFPPRIPTTTNPQVPHNLLNASQQPHTLPHYIRTGTEHPIRHATKEHGAILHTITPRAGWRHYSTQGTLAICQLRSWPRSSASPIVEYSLYCKPSRGLFATMGSSICVFGSCRRFRTSPSAIFYDHGTCSARPRSGPHELRIPGKHSHWDVAPMQRSSSARLRSTLW